jgi:hypothetical protein
MSEQRAYVGGSFAPPLTDELIAEYRKLADALGASPEKDMISSLLTCCEKWWNLPESAGTSTSPHPSGQGVIVKLHPDVAAALDEHIPWPHDLASIQAHADTVEQDKVLRNSEKVQRWHLAVREHVRNKFYPDAGELTAAMKASQNESATTAEEKNAVEGSKGKLKAYEEELRAALSTKKYDAVPMPALESTKVRDALHHLLWHVKELDMGREPMTKDKL